jgi:hypothetical protein
VRGQISSENRKVGKKHKDGRKNRRVQELKLPKFVGAGRGQCRSKKSNLNFQNFSKKNLSKA